MLSMFLENVIASVPNITYCVKLILYAPLDLNTLNKNLTVKRRTFDCSFQGKANHKNNLLDQTNATRGLSVVVVEGGGGRVR